MLPADVRKAVLDILPSGNFVFCNLLAIDAWPAFECRKYRFEIFNDVNLNLCAVYDCCARIDGYEKLRCMLCDSDWSSYDVVESNLYNKNICDIDKAYYYLLSCCYYCGIYDRNMFMKKWSSYDNFCDWFNRRFRYSALFCRDVLSLVNRLESHTSHSYVYLLNMINSPLDIEDWSRLDSLKNKLVVINRLSLPNFRCISLGDYVLCKNC